jgi:hypothetical protein
MACTAGAAQAQDPKGQPHDMSQMDMSSSSWQFMRDGSFDGLFNRQGGPRGGHEVKATNWWMAMLTRSVGAHQLTLTGMFSLDAATAGKAGYREIFQVGEALDGRPLVDRQHPHDLFMQLSAVWRTPLSAATSLIVAGAPVGEPALGPVAFMHRASAAAIPFAPLSHHTFDSTHISFGVATAALEHGRWTAEGSVFNGREPDDHRWDFDFGRMDSVSARLWFRPNEAWSIQVSTGRLVEPEQLEPGNIVRTTASASWLHPTGGGLSAASFGYGRNDDAGRQAVFAEFTRQTGPTTFSSRLEFVQVETDLLVSDVVPHAGGAGRADTVGSLTLGGLRQILERYGLEASIGANLVVYAVPGALRLTHGDHPASFQLFLRLRPRAGAMGRMWNMRMAQ